MRTPWIIIAHETRETKIKKWIAVVIIVAITVSGWFTVHYFTPEEKEQIIEQALETPEGREALAQALIDALEEE
jgi:hypothetical protein